MSFFGLHVNVFIHKLKYTTFALKIVLIHKKVVNIWLYLFYIALITIIHYTIC